MSADEDLAQAQASLKLKGAAALLGIAGTFTFIMGVQLVLIQFYETWIEIVAYGWLALGVALIYLAAMVLRARGWAAVGGTMLGAFATLATSAWGVYAFLGGLFSCMGMLVVPAALGATIVAALSIGDARRASAARARLADAGMDLGL